MALKNAAPGCALIIILSSFVALAPATPFQAAIVRVPPLTDALEKVRTPIPLPGWRLILELAAKVKAPRLCDLLRPESVPPLKVIFWPLLRTLLRDVSILPLLRVMGPVKVRGAFIVRVFVPLLVRPPEPVKPLPAMKVTFLLPSIVRVKPPSLVVPPNTNGPAAAFQVWSAPRVI